MNIVFSSGGYIHLRDETSRKAGALEVIVGKSIPTEGQPKCLGFVPGYNDTPPRYWLGDRPPERAKQ